MSAFATQTISPCTISKDSWMDWKVSNFDRVLQFQASSRLEEDAKRNEIKLREREDRSPVWESVECGINLYCSVRSPAPSQFIHTIFIFFALPLILFVCCDYDYPYLPPTKLMLYYCNSSPSSRSNFSCYRWTKHWFFRSETNL